LSSWVQTVTNHSTQPEQCHVLFGGTAGTITSNTATKIVVTSPAGAGKVTCAS